MATLSPSLLKSNIEKRMENDLSLCHIFGASVAVSQKGEVLYRAHFGTHGPDGRKVDENTLFRLASMTKPITGALILRLMEKGLLHPDDPVEKYLPAFRNPHVLSKDEEGHSVLTPSPVLPTLRNLLSHTSGIASAEYMEKFGAAEKKTVESYVSALAKCPLSYIPGTKSEYSGTAAFDLLVEIAQVVTGREYFSLLKEEILDPCRMENTVFSPDEAMWQRVIPMHTRREGKNAVASVWQGCVFQDFPQAHCLGGAGLVSSLADYLNFAHMLLFEGSFMGKTVLSPASVRMMRTPQVPFDLGDGMQRWGLSVRIVTKEEYQRLPVGAYGWSGAYGTHFFVDPQNQTVGIYLKNSHFDGGAGAKTSANFEQDVAASYL